MQTAENRTGENLSWTNSSAVFQDGTILPIVVDENNGQLCVIQGRLLLDPKKMPGFVRTEIRNTVPQPVPAKTSETEPTKPDETKPTEKPAEDAKTIINLIKSDAYPLDRQTQERVNAKLRAWKNAV
jgi:hypothetical protein